jgi:hypothetical protein
MEDVLSPIRITVFWIWYAAGNYSAAPPPSLVTIPRHPPPPLLLPFRATPPLIGKLIFCIYDTVFSFEKRTCELCFQEDWQLRLKRTECELNVLKHQKDEEIRELKEQVRDLMFYLEAQGKVKSNKLGTAFYSFT